MMHNPPHPGLTLRDDVLPALGVGVQKAADQLGITRQALSAVINGHAAISPEMALRLEAWLGEDRGGRADLWLLQQAHFDLWQTRKLMEDFRRHVRAARIPTLTLKTSALEKRKATAKSTHRKKFVVA